MVQFSEHKDGKTSPNPKVQKLDKLARLLNVQIKIDGMVYGADLDEEYTQQQVVSSNEVAKEYKIPSKNSEVSNDETKTEDIPTQKKRGRPKKSSTPT